MSKYRAIVTFALALFVICGVALWRASAMNVPLSKRDFPQYGLILIRPTDTGFNTKLAQLFGTSVSRIDPDIKSASVILENQGSRNVVSYLVRWEVVLGDGNVLVYDAGASNPRAIMDGGAPGAEMQEKTSAHALQPGSAALVAITGEALLGEKLASVSDVKGSSSTYDFELTDEMASVLSQATSITASIDAVFFDTGEFIGADASKHFNHTASLVRAKKDWLVYLRDGLAQGKTMPELYGEIEAAASSPRPAFGVGPSPSAVQSYSYYRWLFARELKRMRDTSGDQFVRDRVNEFLRIPWKNLRKI